jgi:predicted nucleotidyltransferase
MKTNNPHIPDTQASITEPKACPGADPVIVDCATQLKQALGERLRELWLYGSRARGDARPDSDDDLLVLLDRDATELRERVLDVQVDMLDRHDALVTTLLHTEDDWRQQQGYPLAINIAREAVRL